MNGINVRKVIARVALIALLSISAQAGAMAGFSLLGWSGTPLPIAIEGYVMLAVMGKMDIGPALCIYFASICGGLLEIVANTEGLTDEQREPKYMMAGLVAVLLTFVIWRLSAIEDRLDSKDEQSREVARQREIEDQERLVRLEERRAEIAVLAARPAPPVAVPVTVVEVERPKPAPKKQVAASAPAKLPTPTRDRAREILLGLDGLQDQSNAELGRLHGGSDNWWGQRKRDLEAELTLLSTELVDEKVVESSD